MSSDSETKNGLAFWAPETKKQAHAVRQWYNSCAAQVLAGKQPLRINLDESSVSSCQGGGKGDIVSKRRREPPSEQAHERASQVKQRACPAHVAFISNKPDIQPLLPQVIVGNEATFLLRDLCSSASSLPSECAPGQTEECMEQSGAHGTNHYQPCPCSSWALR